MTNKPLMFEKVFDNIHNTYNRLGKQEVSATHLPRGNFSDICKVLSSMRLLDIITDVNVELVTHEEDIVLIFSKGDAKND